MRPFARRLKYAPMPPLWRAVSVGLHLPADVAQRLWQAMTHADWPTTRSWVHRLIATPVTGSEAHARYLCNTLCSPAQLLTILEALVQEKLITRPQIAEAEEAVLKATAVDGTWHPDWVVPKPLSAETTSSF